jgi:hypothetical protein
MRHVISAPPTIDVSALAANVAGLGPVDRDPTRALAERYGYQTLYEMPAAFQKRVRLELIDAHTKVLRERAHAVLDHSVFAYLADWMRWLWAQTPSEEWEKVLAHAAPAIELSETIHHVITGPAAVYDGFRWLDTDNGRQVERLMRGLYRDFRCEGRVKEVTF